MLGKASNRS